eukprot:INCI1132.3.p1 GENE.INCI1132.3~~INCI1132.3.p1  ORF type:complete len:495 (+),score=74.00 INCI1132.3:469-1953(+)
MKSCSLQYAASCTVLLLSGAAADEHFQAAAPEEPWPTVPSHCDILVAGGSTAALAAAITAAEANAEAVVCLTEPTDWPGGQMTSSGVSAIDFGSLNRRPENQPKSFRDLVSFLHDHQQNPGCWVSTECYDPQSMVNGWVMPRILAAENLVFLDRTVVRGAERHANGSISGLNLVQRRAVAGVDEWELPLSQSLGDWYSPIDSERFEKRFLNISAQVVVEATEFGDVLLTADLAAGQGVERPMEMSAPGSDSTCGQAATLTFYMELLDHDPAEPDPAPPGSTAGGTPFSTQGCCCPQEPIDSHIVETHGSTSGVTSKAGSCDYRTIWSYRRASSRKPTEPTFFEVLPGDVSQQNWGNPSGNDLDNAYLFQPLETARATVSAGQWAGGINLTALEMLEQRAYGWFWAYRSAFPNATDRSRLVLNRNFSGTSHGLSKMPYLRDTRRAVGIDGFRAQQASQTPASGGGTGAGEYFNDTVAFGNYPSDDHNVDTCSAPS